MEPTLENRESFMWLQRKSDMDLWTRPPASFGIDMPLSIQLPMEQSRKATMALQRKQHEDWRKKIVVDNLNQKFHRLLPQTELTYKGFNSSNQLDRQRGILKDPPAKLAMKQAAVNIPALDVVFNPSVDTEARKKGTLIQSADTCDKSHPKGFHPGPFSEYSWSLSRNQIPAHDYQHEKFKNEKGKDFK